VVLIIGGTGALGRAVAQALGTSNAIMVVTYIIDKEMDSFNARPTTIRVTKEKINVFNEGNSVALLHLYFKR
jgi:NAD(P)-dependent dehydrogenase (short-subunit alcohol dehydrogenase family)